MPPTPPRPGERPFGGGLLGSHLATDHDKAQAAWDAWLTLVTAKLNALRAHYKVDDTEHRWLFLAYQLARDFVPGFATIEPSRPRGRPVTRRGFQAQQDRKLLLQLRDASSTQRNTEWCRWIAMTHNRGKLPESFQKCRANTLRAQLSLARKERLETQRALAALLAAPPSAGLFGLSPLGLPSPFQKAPFGSYPLLNIADDSSAEPAQKLPESKD